MKEMGHNASTSITQCVQSNRTVEDTVIELKKLGLTAEQAGEAIKKWVLGSLTEATVAGDVAGLPTYMGTRKRAYPGFAANPKTAKKKKKLKKIHEYKFTDFLANAQERDDLDAVKPVDKKAEDYTMEEIEALEADWQRDPATYTPEEHRALELKKESDKLTKKAPRIFRRPKDTTPKIDFNAMTAAQLRAYLAKMDASKSADAYVNADADATTNKPKPKEVAPGTVLVRNKRSRLHRQTNPEDSGPTYIYHGKPTEEKPERPETPIVSSFAKKSVWDEKEEAAWKKEHDRLGIK